MSNKISILIPVYRESVFLEPLLTRLLKDPYENKEIYVIIDEPTQKSIQTSKKFAGNVNFIFNGERKGKANVLNEIVKEASGDIYLFLDADTLVDGNGKSFLETIAKEMENADIIEVKKEVFRDSFVAKVVSYDYLSFNLTNWYFSRKIGRCLGVNGAAFAIKRKIFDDLGGFRRVICEDLDIATRSFVSGARFKFIDKVTVYTKVPSSWKEWFTQRKRWGIGAALWFKENFNLLKNTLRKYPLVILPSLLFIFPALPLLLMGLFTPDDLTVKIFYVSLILLSTKTSVFLPPIAVTSTTISILRNFFIFLGSLVFYTSIFYVIARKFQFCFNPLEFAVFYFVIAPLWLLIIIASLIKVYAKPDKIRVDWKI